MDNHTLLNEDTNWNTNDYGSYCTELSDLNEFNREYAPINSEIGNTQTTSSTTNDYFLFELNPDKKSYMVSSKNKDSIPSLITIPSDYNNLPVTRIKKGGFFGFLNLTIVLFDKKSNIKTIDSYAFSGCTNIQSFALPSSIHNINTGAFHSCENLQQVYLHSKFPPKLGINVFGNTSDFLTIYVPCKSIIYYRNYIRWSEYRNQIQAIPYSIPSNLGYFNFTLNDDENNYTISAKSTSILPEFLNIPSMYNNKPITIVEKMGFARSSIKGIYFPDTIERIESEAFYHPVSTMLPDYIYSTSCLEKVIFGKNSRLNFIGTLAFWGNMKLESVQIPSQVITIGDQAFGACHLFEIYIPDKVETIGSGLLSYSIYLKYIIVGKGNQSYKSIGGVLYNRDETTLVSYPLAKEEYSYTIPATVTEISGYSNSFWGCKNLRVLYLDPIKPPSSANTFQTAIRAFKIYVPDESYNSYKYADGWNNIAFKIYPNGILHDNFAISMDTLIQYVGNDDAITIPKDITVIQSNALASCINLKNIFVADDNKYYKSVDGVLFNFDITRVICYPPAKIEDQYELPKTVNSIGSASFLGCDNLITLKTHKALEVIEEYAFASCSRLQNFINLDAIDHIKIIFPRAFLSCTGIHKITLMSIETLSTEVFSLCKNTISLTLGENINSIGFNLFNSGYDNIKLDQIIVYAANPPELTGGFRSNIPKAIYVLPEAVELYKTASIWNNYKDIIYPLTTTIIK